MDIGTQIETLVGEKSDGPSGESLSCPAGSVGKVLSADHYPAQGWTYGVEFPGGVFVFLTAAELSDPSKYWILGRV